MPDFYDTSLDNPYDADYNFSFLDNYIQNVSRKAATPASNQVIENGSDFYDTQDQDEAIESEPEIESLSTEGQENNENKFFQQDDEFGLMNDDEISLSQQFMSETYRNGNIQGSGGSYVQTGDGVIYKPGVNSKGWNPKTASIVDSISEMIGGVTVTSTVRSKAENDSIGGKPNSFHLTGEAVDLRPSAQLDAFLSSPQGKQYMALQGYQIVDERSKKSGAHWHLEPVKRKYGGPVAKTPAEKRIGLNDESIDSLFIPLKGTNTIRGLDNGEPVHVVDETGNEVVLFGPDDTVQMEGSVKEKRISKRKYSK